MRLGKYKSLREKTELWKTNKIYMDSVNSTELCPEKLNASNVVMLGRGHGLHLAKTHELEHRKTGKPAWLDHEMTTGDVSCRATNKSLWDYYTNKGTHKGHSKSSLMKIYPTPPKNIKPVYLDSKFEEQKIIFHRLDTTKIFCSPKFGIIDYTNTEKPVHYEEGYNIFYDYKFVEEELNEFYYFVQQNQAFIDMINNSNQVELVHLANESTFDENLKWKPNRLIQNDYFDSHDL